MQYIKQNNKVPEQHITRFLSLPIFLLTSLSWICNNPINLHIMTKDCWICNNFVNHIPCCCYALCMCVFSFLLLMVNSKATKPVFLASITWCIPMSYNFLKLPGFVPNFSAAIWKAYILFLRIRLRNRY